MIPFFWHLRTTISNYSERNKNTGVFSGASLTGRGQKGNSEMGDGNILILG